MKNNAFILILTCLLYACTTEKKELPITEIAPKSETQDVIMVEQEQQVKISLDDLADTSFLFLEDVSDDFTYDMRYATTNNFLDTAIYACNKCMIRKKVALALVKAQKLFKESGYSIKFFDCYRPLDVQKKMWKTFPDRRYVANPKHGSVHNRGGAVDITLESLTGEQLDMGTSFDHFGKEAHHDYAALSDTVIQNRLFLVETMKKAGFRPIRTEWWHYNYGGAKHYPISNVTTKCDD
ncbi:MAG: M15 family metallopeptidase [Reichenbachiella sp.]